MGSKNSDNILKLLALVVLVDKRVYKEEVDTLAVEAENILKNTLGLFMTQSMAVDWFQTNRTSLQALLDDEFLDYNLNVAIKCVDEFPDKTSLRRAMLRVAYADDEFHDSENRLIRMAGQKWGLEPISSLPGQM